MSKKIYAKILNPELFDYRVYEDEITSDDRIIIDGGRDFADVNDDLLKDIKKFIREYNDYYYETYYKCSIKAYVDDMLPKKVNNKPYSPKELQLIKNALDNERHDSDIITLCLTIIKNEEYDMYPLRGSCQGDYVECYAPKHIDKKYIDYIECWFFGTGTEVMIHDEDNEPEDANEISGFTFYTSSWRTEDIIQEVRDQVCSKEKDIPVVLYKFDKYIRMEHYEKMTD